MKISTSLVLSAILLAVVGCGVETNEDNSGQTCESSHECINDVCECKTEGNAGNSCDDNDSCVEACEVCN